MKFVKFREYNDHEGEKWNFWLQLDGNEEELAKLKEAIDTVESGGELYYTLDMGPITEAEVDTLVKYGDSGYMDYQNKVTGKFTCPDFGVDSWEHEVPDEAWEMFDDNFYKGDIQRHFEAV